MISLLQHKSIWEVGAGLRLLEGPGGSAGAWQRVCSEYPPVALRGPLLSGRTLGRELFRETRQCGLGKRTGLTHLMKTCGVPPPLAGLPHCVLRQGDLSHIAWFDGMGESDIWPGHSLDEGPTQLGSALKDWSAKQG